MIIVNSQTISLTDEFDRTNSDIKNLAAEIEHPYKFQTKLHRSPIYRRSRSISELITFTDNEYKKFLSELLKIIIIKNVSKINFHNNQIEIIIDKQINITV